MTVAIANVDVINTFDFWRKRVNDCATVISTQAVTVNSNAAVGDATITGRFRANTVFSDIIAGGTLAVPAALTISTNTTFSANINVTGPTLLKGLLVVNAAATFNANVAFAGTSNVTIGTTVINGSNITSTFFGTWSGVNIAIAKGGTGVSTTPANGQLLIGGVAGYTVASVTGTGITVVPGNGTLGLTANVVHVTNGTAMTVTSAAGVYTVNNIGVTSIRATGNVTPKTGAVVLNTADITDALGYVPGSSGGAVFIASGTDAFFPSGNVAIGITGAPVANAMFNVRGQSGTVPAVLIENGNNVTTGHSILTMSTANASASAIINFGVAGVPRGVLQYNNGSDVFSFSTGGTQRATIDSTSVFIGTGISPSPNEGGQGLHVYGTLPGVTIQSTNGLIGSWIAGIAPAFNPLAAGARVASAFAIYNDTLGNGLVFDGSGATSTYDIYTNSASRMKIDATGKAAIGTAINTTYQLTLGAGILASEHATPSDYRLKENVGPIFDSVGRLKQMNFVSYNMIGKTTRKEGVIAHEAQPLIPHAVTGVKDGFEHQAVDYSSMVPLLGDAMQKLINRVEELEARIAE
jgi:hypothetical protein